MQISIRDVQNEEVCLSLFFFLSEIHVTEKSQKKKKKDQDASYQGALKKDPWPWTR